MFILHDAVTVRREASAKMRVRKQPSDLVSVREDKLVNILTMYALTERACDLHLWKFLTVS